MGNYQGSYDSWQYDIANDNWEWGPYLSWGPVNCITELGDNLYYGNGDSNYGYISRWGEQLGYIDITGVPYEICQDASPITLPTTQSGYTGSGSGSGGCNNIFNPAGLLDYVEITFTPDPGQCVGAVDFYIYVYLNTDYLTPLNTFCENSDPISLIPYQNGINGDWSGPGVTNN